MGFDAAEQQIALSDGGTGLEDLFRRHFPRAEVILDFWHAREHLVELAQELFAGDDQTRQQWIEDRWHQLKHQGGEAVSATLEHWSRVRRLAVRPGPSTYITSAIIATRWTTRAICAEGWQIGSGPVEAACKSVVSHRLKRSGMRWGVDGADAVCHLRALHQSGPALWQTFWRTYRNSGR